jgi:UDP-glucuronate decarboxylase
MIELANKIQALLGRSATIAHLPMPQDDPPQRRPDIALARARLGWTPTTKLDAGLRDTIAYFKSVLAVSA